MNRTAIPRRGAHAAVLAVVVAGCAPAGPETFPVSGKIVVKSGDLSPFVGKVIEFRSETDPTVRSYSFVEADGSFKLSTMYSARTKSGAVAGLHKGRFPLEGGAGQDDDRPRKKKGVDTKYGTFEKSGWEFQVPVTGEVTLMVE